MRASPVCVVGSALLSTLSLGVFCVLGYLLGCVLAQWIGGRLAPEWQAVLVVPALVILPWYAWDTYQACLKHCQRNR